MQNENPDIAPPAETPLTSGYHLLLRFGDDWIGWQTIRDNAAIPVEFVTSRPMTDEEVGVLIRFATEEVSCSSSA